MRAEFAPRQRIDRQINNTEFSPVIQPRKLAVSVHLQDSVPRTLGNIDAMLAVAKKAPKVTLSQNNNDSSMPVYEMSVEKDYRTAKEKLSFTSNTREYINFFKNFYKEEGLPKDWQNLQYGDTQVGFSIKGQMELFKEDTPESRKIWALQTYRDLQGYMIEYISPYNVYPWMQEKRANSDGTANLVDVRYGGKRMVDTATNKERGGSVKAVLQIIDQAVVSGKAKDGSMFLQVSPADETPTGLVQDSGQPIVYKETHLIFSQVRGDRLEGFTVKTDFTKAECRELILRVSGKVIPPDAPIEDYIKAFAFIDPRKSKFQSIDDLVKVAAEVRSDLSFGSDKVYKDKSFDYVVEQIGLGKKLYDWTETSQIILKQFVHDVIRDNPKKEELPDYIAATILRAVEAAQIDSLNQAAVETATQQLHSILPPSNFGDILKGAAAISGCAGGGTTSASSGVQAAYLGGAESCPEISCPCGWKANASEVESIQAGNLTHCPECGSPPGGGTSALKAKEEVEEPTLQTKENVILAA